MAHCTLRAAARAAIGALGAFALAACATTQSTTQGASDEEYAAAIDVFSNGEPDSRMDPIAAAAYWGAQYNTDQRDPKTAVKFSAALRAINSTDEALTVMQKAYAVHEQDPDVSLEYGKTLIEAGRAFEAVRPLEYAAAKRFEDWRAHSAYGVALDQIGEHEKARFSYNRALQIAPNAASVINNKGLSYAVSGDLDLATLTLRKAAASGGDARVRQNLALVLALSGDMLEAERLARSDLPPPVADNNVQYFRQLMAQPAYWEEYAASAADAPVFDEPAAPAPLSPAKPTPAQPAPSTPAPLRVEPKPDAQEDADEGAPVALIEATPPTNASSEPNEIERILRETPALREEAGEPIVVTDEEEVDAPDTEDASTDAAAAEVEDEDENENET